MSFIINKRHDDDGDDGDDGDGDDDKKEGDIKRDIVYDVVTGGGKRMKFWCPWGRGMYSSEVDEAGADPLEGEGDGGDDDPGSWSTIKKKVAVKKQYNTVTVALLSIPGGEVLSGDSAGGLHFWVKSVVGGSIKYKKSLLLQEHGPVTALKLWAEGGWVSASPYSLKLWSLKKEVVRAISLEDILTRVNRLDPMGGLLHPTTSFVRSVDVDRHGMRLLVFFSFSLLVEVSIDTGDATILVEGSPSPVSVVSSYHVDDDTPAGCCWNPFLVITGHEDKCIRAWDVINPKGVVGYLSLAATPRAIVYLTHDILIVGGNSKVMVIAVATKGHATHGTTTDGNTDGATDGTTDGADLNKRLFHQCDKRVLSVTLEVVDEVGGVGKGDVTAIKVSPDKKVLAVGSTDGAVYFLSLHVDQESSGSSKVSVTHIGSATPFPATGGSCPVSAMDFSACSSYIRVFSANFGYKHQIVTVFYELYQEEEKRVVVDETDAAKKTGTWLSSVTGKKDAKEVKQAVVVFKPAKVVDALKLKPLIHMKWASVSSPAAPAASFTMTTTITPRTILTPTVDGRLIMCVGYNDGSITIFKHHHDDPHAAHAAHAPHARHACMQLFTDPLHMLLALPTTSSERVSSALEGVMMCVVGGRYLVAIGYVDSYFTVIDLQRVKLQ